MTNYIGRLPAVVSLLLCAALLIPAPLMAQTAPETQTQAVTPLPAAGMITSQQQAALQIDASVSNGTQIIDVSQHDGHLQYSGNFVNNGTLYLWSSDPNFSVATLSANNIWNRGTISTALPSDILATLGNPVDSLDLVLNAVQALFNSGTIASAGNLTINAASVVNALPEGITGAAPVMQAMGNLNLNTGNIVNAGILQSVQSNINMQTLGDLMVNNVNGRMEALNGVINIRDMLAVGKIDTVVLGGDFLSNEFNIWTGTGMADLNVGKVSGVLNIVGGDAHVNSNAPGLELSLTLSGDPIIGGVGTLVLRRSRFGGDWLFPGVDPLLISALDFTDDEGNFFPGIITNEDVEVISTSGDDTHPLGSGAISLRADTAILLEGTPLRLISTANAVKAGNIVVAANSGDVRLPEGLVIDASSTSGTSGSVGLGGPGQLVMREGTVTTSNGTGFAGLINIVAGNGADLTNTTFNASGAEGGGQIQIAVLQTPQLGNPTLLANGGLFGGSIEINYSNISSGVITVDATIQAEGGEVGGDVRIGNETDAILQIAGLDASVHSSDGASGDIFITSQGDLEVVALTVNLNSVGQGAAGGDLTLFTLSDLILNNVTVTSNGGAGGNGGNILLGGFTIGNTGASSFTANGTGRGSGGSVAFTATSDLSLTAADGISVSATGGRAGTDTASGSGAGDGGKIRAVSSEGLLTVDTTVWDVAPKGRNGRGGTIFLQGGGPGGGGPIETLSFGPESTPGGPAIVVNGVLNADGVGTGRGGEIFVHAGGNSSLDIGSGPGQIQMSAQGAGGGSIVASAGGDMNVDASGMNVSATNGNGGAISLTAGTAGTGNLNVIGDVNVSGAGARGNGGSIALNASSDGSGGGGGGVITLMAFGGGMAIAGFSTDFGAEGFGEPTPPVVGGAVSVTGSLIANAAQRGTGGSIQVAGLGSDLATVTIGSGQEGQSVSAQGGTINGGGGTVDITAGGNVDVQTQLISTSARAGTSDGNNITIDAGTSGFGTFTTTANMEANGSGGGSGGSIDLSYNGDLIAFSNLSAVAPGRGTGGTVKIENTSGTGLNFVGNSSTINVDSNRGQNGSLVFVTPGAPIDINGFTLVGDLTADGSTINIQSADAGSQLTLMSVNSSAGDTQIRLTAAGSVMTFDAANTNVTSAGNVQLQAGSMMTRNGTATPAGLIQSSGDTTMSTVNGELNASLNINAGSSLTVVANGTGGSTGRITQTGGTWTAGAVQLLGGRIGLPTNTIDLNAASVQVTSTDRASLHLLTNTDFQLSSATNRIQVFADGDVTVSDSMTARELLFDVTGNFTSGATLNATGLISIEANSIVQVADEEVGSLQSHELFLASTDSIGSGAAPLEIMTDLLSAQSTSGDIFLNQTGGNVRVQLGRTLFNDFSLTASNNINAAGVVAADTVMLASTGANGVITIHGMTAGTSATISTQGTGGQVRIQDTGMDVSTGGFAITTSTLVVTGTGISNLSASTITASNSNLTVRVTDSSLGSHLSVSAPGTLTLNGQGMRSGDISLSAATITVTAGSNLDTGTFVAVATNNITVNRDVVLNAEGNVGFFIGTPGPVVAPGTTPAGVTVTTLNGGQVAFGNGITARGTNFISANNANVAFEVGSAPRSAITIGPNANISAFLPISHIQIVEDMMPAVIAGSTQLESLIGRGERVLEAADDAVIAVGDFDLQVRKNSIVLVMLDNKCVRFVVLHDSSRGSCALTRAGKKLAVVCAGEELALATGLITANALPNFPRRHTEVAYHNGYSVVKSEVPLVTLFSQSKALTQIRNDKAQAHRWNQLQKTAACLSIVTSGHGWYKHSN